MALFLPTLLLASVVIFLIMRVLPGDVAQVVLGGSGEVTQDLQQIERVREQLGLNDPLIMQYGGWMRSLAGPDLGGASLDTRETLRSLLARQAPVTILLAVYTMALAILFAIPLGVLAARTHNRWPDQLIRLLTFSGQALPSFFVALLALLVLVLAFHWSPPIRYAAPWRNPWDHLQIMAVPVAVLAWGYGAYLARITRAAVLEVIEEDYIRMARGKGLPQRAVTLKHALRNALIPVVTVAGLQTGAMLSGIVVLEALFGLPGLGRGIVQAVASRDYPVVQTLTLVAVGFMLCLNLLIDATYAAIDPRVRYRV